MIQEIRIKNYKCFKDEVTLSFEAVEEDTFQLDRQTVKVAENVHLLRFAAIYGANASGKSTVLEVMGLLRNILWNNPQKEDKLDETPFLLDNYSSSEPTNITMISWLGQNKKCTYEISLNRKLILSEKFMIEDDLIFDRNTNTETEISRVFITDKISDKAKGFIEYSCSRNRSVANIISSMNLPNNEEALALVREYLNLLAIDIPHQIDMRKCYNENDFSLFIKDAIPQILPVLNQMGFDITNIAVHKNNESWKSFFTHNVESNGNVHVCELPYSEESDGTKSFIYLLTSLLWMGGPCDEPDNSMHTSLFIKLIDWWLNREATRNHQLLITTHNTELLDSVNHIIRADSIWFVNKDKHTGASEMYSLVDFGGLNKIPLFSKAYLAGCFDALPNIEETIQDDENSVYVDEFDDYVIQNSHQCL